MPRGRARKATQTGGQATQRQTRSNTANREEVQTPLPNGALQTRFHIDPTVSQWLVTSLQNEQPAPNTDPSPDQQSSALTPVTPRTPRVQTGATSGLNIPQVGFHNPFIQVHVQDQNHPPMNVPPTSGAHIQAIIVQTPHRFGIAATPIHNHHPPPVTDATHQPSITAVVSSDELEGSDSESSAAPPQRQVPSRKANDVWTFFRQDARTKERVCTLCEAMATSENPDFRIAKYSSSTGTTILRGHLQKYHIAEWIKICDEKKLVISGQEARAAVADYRLKNGHAIDFISVQNNQPLPRMRFTKENFLQAVIKFVVSDDQALNILENDSFRALLLLLRNDLEDSDIPHRNYLRTQIISNWKQHLVSLKAEMKQSTGKISLTVDLWSDENLSPFMGVTAHHINVKSTFGARTILQLRSYLIGFHRIPGRHTGEHLAQMLLYVLDRLEISRKIGWITLDNAANNDTCIAALAVELTGRGITGFNTLERRIRCFPHIVNLSCQAVIEKITDMAWAALASEDYDSMQGAATDQYDVVAMLRNTIRAIRSSSLRRDGFAETCRRLGLPDHELIRDVDTRWSSTYLMILRALKLQTAIDRYLSLSPEMSRYSLQEQDWRILRNYGRILAVPHAFQQVLSAEKTPTLCEAMPAFIAMISRWRELQQALPDYYETIQAGIQKLEQYQLRVTSVPAYTLSILINPAMKLDWFRDNMPGQVEVVRELFISHLSHYQRAGNTAGVNTSSQMPSVDNNFDLGDDPSLILGLRNLSVANTQVHDLRTEVEAYFLDAHRSSNSLFFWQESCLRYPTIYLLALDYLPIQGSAVPCERIFSSAKETMTLRRNRINPELMEALQMLKFSYNQGYELNFTTGLSRAEEFAHLMQLTEEESRVPEDVTSFINSLNSPIA